MYNRLFEYVLREAGENCNDFVFLSEILNTEKSKIITHKKIGNIFIDYTGKANESYGLKSIIIKRTNKDKRNEEFIAALLYLILQSVKEGEIIRDNKVYDKNGQDIGQFELKKNGIVAIIRKIRSGTTEKFLLTGYDVYDNEIDKKAATDAIQAVIAQYGYTSDFSYLKSQIGAVTASNI
jgi:hypothetical protein